MTSPAVSGRLRLALLVQPAGELPWSVAVVGHDVRCASTRRRSGARVQARLDGAGRNLQGGGVVHAMPMMSRTTTAARNSGSSVASATSGRPVIGGAVGGRILISSIGSAVRLRRSSTS
jgi:hypothetical protein